MPSVDADGIANIKLKIERLESMALRYGFLTIRTKSELANLRKRYKHALQADNTPHQLKLSEGTPCRQ